MAAGVLTDVTLLVNGMDMSPFSGEFTCDEMAQMVPADNFAGQGYSIVLPGLFSAEATIKGHADYAAGAVSSTFNSASKGVQAGVSILPAGSLSVEGTQCSFMSSKLKAMKMLTGPVGSVADFDMAFASDAAEVEGFVSAPLASRTTAGLTTTGQQIVGGVPNGKRMYAALHVTAAAGTNLAVKIQSDDNSGFTTPTDRITFSTVSATGWQFGSVAGPLTGETYWRTVVTIATSTFTFATVLGVA